jgi:hypothetical protein
MRRDDPSNKVVWFRVKGWDQCCPQLSLKIGGTREDARGRLCPSCPATKHTLESARSVPTELFQSVCFFIVLIQSRFHINSNSFSMSNYPQVKSPEVLNNLIR